MGVASLHATTISITTTQSGGVYNIDATQSAIWNITISEAGAAAGLSVVSGNFSLKRDNGATDPVVFSFYRGFSYNSTGGTQLLGSASVAPGAIPTNAFPVVLFNINATGNLTAGAYSFMLTSTGARNSAFNMKGAPTDAPLLVSSANGTAINSTYFANAGPNPTPYITPTPTPTPTPGPTPGPTPVPEPGQVAASILVAAGIAVYWFLKRKKQSPSA